MNTMPMLRGKSYWGVYIAGAANSGKSMCGREDVTSIVSSLNCRSSLLRRPPNAMFRYIILSNL
jgi:hypothetical protein